MTHFVIRILWWDHFEGRNHWRRWWCIWSLLYLSTHFLAQLWNNEFIISKCNSLLEHEMGWNLNVLFHGGLASFLTQWFVEWILSDFCMHDSWCMLSFPLLCEQGTILKFGAWTRTLVIAGLRSFTKHFSRWLFFSRLALIKLNLTIWSCQQGIAEITPISCQCSESRNENPKFLKLRGHGVCDTDNSAERSCSCIVNIVPFKRIEILWLCLYHICIAPQISIVVYLSQTCWCASQQLLLSFQHHLDPAHCHYVSGDRQVSWLHLICLEANTIF